MTKHYAERNLLKMDLAGNFYGNHVMAMTAEQLHSKSDIAAELGWRDMQIASLKEQLTATTNILKSAGIEADTVQAGVMELVSRMNQVAAENYDLKHPGTYLPSKCETPATDAYLNAVRADAVEDVAKRLYGQGYNFEVLTRFATQLRSGNAGKDGV